MSEQTARTPENLPHCANPGCNGPWRMNSNREKAGSKHFVTGWEDCDYRGPFGHTVDIETEEGQKTFLAHEVCWDCFMENCKGVWANVLSDEENIDMLPIGITPTDTIREG